MTLQGPVTAGTTPNEATLRPLVQFLRPEPEELQWQAIPWETDLWIARRRAAEERKPIFLWAMNGNPLGCT
jgi:hypothetical protein